MALISLQLAQKERYTHYHFIVQNIFNGDLPFKSNFFDIVISSHILEHVRGDVRLIKQINRVLRPGGIAIIMVPINEKKSNPFHLRRYSKQRLCRTLTEHGFSILCVVENGRIESLVWDKFSELKDKLFNENHLGIKRNEHLSLRKFVKFVLNIWSIFLMKILPFLDENPFFGIPRNLAIGAKKCNSTSTRIVVG
jgi:SAM-dependent methyltransferase